MAKSNAVASLNKKNKHTYNGFLSFELKQKEAYTSTVTGLPLTPLTYPQNAQKVDNCFRSHSKGKVKKTNSGGHFETPSPPQKKKEEFSSVDDINLHNSL